ncbi:hypothetical protein K2X30_10935 [bacterium]|nr:hypothetical protein [bacterium]
MTTKSDNFGYLKYFEPSRYVGRLRTLSKKWQKHFDKKRLNLVYQGFRNSSGFDKRIPSPNEMALYSGSFAAARSLKEFSTAFSKEACLNELPELLKIAKYEEGQKTLNLFDYGCGLGRLAYAFTNYFGKSENFQYCGYEILPQAVRFLKSAYEDYPNVTILNDKILFEKSYIEIEYPDPQSKKDGRVEPKSLSLADRCRNVFNIQYSHSVFTHMDRGDIVQVLKNFNSSFISGVCVNTWLIIDRFAESSLRAGLADRDLPYEVDGYLTYDQHNPLLCSAYRLKDIEKIYEEAGHEILNIFFGSWSGRIPQQKFSTQDVIVSRPIRS